MKVAVTGATGFVGRHVVAALLKQDVEVIAAARSHSGQVPENDALKCVVLDFENTEAPFAKLCEPDVIIHLGWGGLPNYSSNDHVQRELPNQIAFLEACVGAGLQKLVISGTCLEYGMRSGCLTEEMSCSPVVAYGQAKNQLRIHLQSSLGPGNTMLTWARLFYLYGAGQAPTALYSQLMHAITSGASEFWMSPGDQRRDFLPVKLAASMLCDLALTKPAAGIVNVCSGTPVSIESMARKWLKDGNSALKLKLGAFPYPAYEPMDFWGSTSKLQTLLGAK